MGVSPTGTSGFGKLVVKGFRRVPLPPARMIARSPAADRSALLILCSYYADTALDELSDSRPSGTAPPPTLFEAPIPTMREPSRRRTAGSPPRSSSAAAAHRRLRSWHCCQPLRCSAVRAGLCSQTGLDQNELFRPQCPESPPPGEMRGQYLRHTSDPAPAPDCRDEFPLRRIALGPKQ